MGLSMWYVYVIQSKKDNSLYTGFTNDLKRRFGEHNAGKNISTKHKTPFELVEGNVMLIVSKGKL